MLAKFVYSAALITCTLMAACTAPSKNNPGITDVKKTDQIHFSAPVKVIIQGLPIGHGNSRMSIEEPFVSRDGQFLFFNSNEKENKKDLHHARWVQGNWVYNGEIGPGINRPRHVDANPTMDAENNFYFIASGTKSFIKKGRFNPDTGTVTGVDEVAGFPEIEPRLFRFKVITNMGVEVSADGTTAYFSRAAFRMVGLKPAGILASNILFAEKIEGQFVYNENNARRIMANVNTSDLEYAASTSKDGLVLFFTRLSANDLESGNIRSAILYAARPAVSEPFGPPKLIAPIGTSGFVEGPAISADGLELYYHKRENSKFSLYKVRILKPLSDEHLK